MNKNKLIAYTFALAAILFTLGIINHLVNTHETIFFPILLVILCMMISFYFFKKSR